MRIRLLTGWQIAAAFGTAGMATMALIAIAMPNIYRSIGAFGIPEGKQMEVNQAAQEFFASDAALRQILDSHGLRDFDLEEAKKRLIIKGGHARTVRNETVVMVAFDSRDASISQAVAADFMDILMKRLESLGVAARTTDTPRIPIRPLSPAWQIMQAEGCIGGLMCGGIAVLIKRRRVQSL